ncbi:MAG: hypothetical protein RLZZ200_2618 [Pseudomonadota bacterium]|jgi:hypothetical protein
MSLPLKELRFGATEITHILLDHHARANGLDKSEMARQIIGEWAYRMAHAHTMVEEELAAKRIKLDRAALRSIVTGADSSDLDRGRA